MRSIVRGWHRFVDWFGASAGGSWLYSRIGPPIDRILLKASRGRISLALGKPVALLYTIGAKSGLPRQTPVIYTRSQDCIILIASNFGSVGHPAWYYNVVANSTVQLLLNGNLKNYRARLAIGDEYEVLWTRALHYYNGFEVYKVRASHREIPLFILDPLDSE